MRRRNARGSVRRRGVTLVELMVLLTAVGLMLAICTTLLGLTIRLEADGRAAFERSEAIARLSGRFRNDVHEADAAVQEARTVGLSSQAGRRIEYRLSDEGEVSRVVIVDGKETARETYRIPQTSGARWDVREVEGSPLVVLVIDVQPRRDRIDPVKALEISALVGKTVFRGGAKP